MTGKVSTFGGKNDEGMKNDTGLALYEPHEANLRPDIFFPADPKNPNQPTWQRLNPYFPYMAIRFERPIDRKGLQLKPWIIRNPKTNKFVTGFVVDYGPHESTDRIVDLSPQIMKTLDLETDDVVEVLPV